MAFTYDITDKLKEKIKLFAKRNKPLAQKLTGKIAEIANRDVKSVEFYKNLNAPMQAYKRVYIGSFVLLFRVQKDKNHIVFWDFDHHDNIYD